MKLKHKIKVNDVLLYEGGRLGVHIFIISKIDGVGKHRYAWSTTGMGIQLDKYDHAAEIFKYVGRFTPGV